MSKEPLLSDRQIGELSETPGPVGDPHLPSGSNNKTTASASPSAQKGAVDPLERMQRRLRRSGSRVGSKSHLSNE